MVSFDFLTLAFICLFVSFILSEIFLKLKYPRVIGQILTGLILSMAAFKTFFSYDSLTLLQFMSDLGIVFLLLLTGLSLNLDKILKSEKDVILIAISCVFVPFALGTVGMVLLGYSWFVGMIVGAIISLTAEGTKMEVLYDLKVLNTKLGNIMIGASIFDDIFEFLFLSILIVVLQGGIEQLYYFPIRLIAFIIIIYLIFRIMPYCLKVVKLDKVRYSAFSLIVIIGLFISIIAAHFQLSLVLGALIAGLLLNKSEGNNDMHKRHIAELELITFTIFVPFFFVNTGLQVDVLSLFNHPYLTITIILLAVVGKIAGALLVKPFTDLSYKQLHIVGWGMNSRGLIELVLASFALQHHLIPIEIYSALVTMAFITTIIFPFVIKYLSKDRKIWYT